MSEIQLPEAFLKLGEVLEQGQFELLFTEEKLRLVYLMNDAVESFLVFENARMTGQYREDYEGELEAELSVTEEPEEPEPPAGNYVDTLIGDMTLFHDGPCDVLEVIAGWGPGMILPVSKSMPSGWTHVLGWFHVMEDTQNISQTNLDRPWRVAGPYTGNTAPNSRVQCKDLQFWYLDMNNVWRLHGRRQSPGGTVYPIDWSLNSPTYATTWRDESSNGGGSSLRDLGRLAYEGYTWHSYTSPQPLPAHRALAACFFGRLILDNPNGADDRASCRILGACAGDYYMDAWTAGDGPEITGVNVRDAGWSRLKYFTNDWQLFAFYTSHSLTQAQLRANPPPFIGV